MARANRETRLQIMLDEDELRAVDDWRFAHRLPSRAAAIRQLLQIGLGVKTHWRADSGKPSQDYGILPDNPDAD